MCDLDGKELATLGTGPLGFAVQWRPKARFAQPANPMRVIWRPRAAHLLLGQWVTPPDRFRRVKPNDPMTFAIVVAIMLGAGTAATLAARIAATTDSAVSGLTYDWERQLTFFLNSESPSLPKVPVT